MWFDGRELKPYIEPVGSDRLVVGEIYYRIGLIGNKQAAIYLSPHVYMGKNIFGDDQKIFLYFQDAESYLDGRRCDKESDSDHVSVRRVEDRSDDPMAHGYCQLNEAINELLALFVHLHSK
jgi:hypothetical protein